MISIVTDSAPSPSSSSSPRPRTLGLLLGRPRSELLAPARLVLRSVRRSAASPHPARRPHRVLAHRAPNVAAATASAARTGATSCTRKHARAALVCEHARGDRARAACPPRRRGSPRDSGSGEDPPEEALARGPDHQRAPERGELVQAAQQLEVVREGLAEADPGVEQHALLGDPLAHGERQALLEERLDVVDDVLVARVRAASCAARRACASGSTPRRSAPRPPPSRGRPAGR